MFHDFYRTNPNSFWCNLIQNPHVCSNTLQYMMLIYTTISSSSQNCQAAGHWILPGWLKTSAYTNRLLQWKRLLGKLWGHSLESWIWEWPELTFKVTQRLTPMVCVTLKIKLDEEKSKHAGLAQQNGFGPAFVKFAEPGRRHNKAEHLAEKSTKCDMTAVLCFWLSNRSDSSK